MYDLAVIGAGWAGFNAALKAKNLGLKVALIEKGQIGGTCLNYGCVPTKALIQSAKAYLQCKKSANFGLESVSPPIPNFIKIQERKNRLIQQLRSGMQFLFKDIDFFASEAELESCEELKVGNTTIKAKSILIATGSKSIELADFTFDGKKILSSDDILNLTAIPKSLLIIGGGVIGCEFAGLFRAFGCEVTIVELMPQLLPGMDKEISRKLEAGFKKKGVKLNTNTDAKTQNLENYELVLVCVGRSAESSIPGLERIGVRKEKSRIWVDDCLKTNIPNIYAAGDCTGKIMLAHYAAYQGAAAAQNIARPQENKMADNPNIPNCIFTDPEVASVGLSEEEALSKGFEIKINKFDFLGSGMARILDEAEGFVKILSDKKTECILGASIIGPKATELIAILGLAISNHLKIPQIRETIFAHPTLSESISEALKD
jgi:dihydrolipoamide dehydrogenase